MITMTKPTFMLCIETISVPQQTYLPVTKPVQVYLRIRKQLSASVAVLLWELLPEIVDN
ncbi:hypothetical protein HOLleu_16765 [Holothuria leucospilota]|uniref:Uncharacterized protein n=1 Tax=Holothuria leucospilota TaxID=206669 RepID=A0A9Q1C697_HOLLE|nr:hypothetical protein HOLleu_16765 [Holothuria leucospilota]